MLAKTNRSIFSAQNMTVRGFSKKVKIDIHVDYYKKLGVWKNSSEMEIARAYYKQAIKWHPDNNDGNFTQEF